MAKKKIVVEDWEKIDLDRAPTPEEQAEIDAIVAKVGKVDPADTEEDTELADLPELDDGADVAALGIQRAQRPGGAGTVSDSDLKTMIRQRLSPDQRQQFDELDAKMLDSTLDLARRPDGVTWVVEHWGLLMDQAGFLKDF